MERWIVIEDYPDYEVSDYGNVRNRRTGRILKPQLNRDGGYLRVNLGNVHCYIHRLVAEAFCGGRHIGLDVNHINGNKYDNSARNLEWCTRKANIRHAFDNGQKFPAIVNPVRCRDCRLRYMYEWCLDKSDDFYCAYGEGRKTPIGHHLIRCRYCGRRCVYDVCEDKNDDFYCAYGRR